MPKSVIAKHPTLVLIHWKDAAAHHDPLEDEDFGLIDCLSVGWAVEMTDEYVKLASELGADGIYREGVVIPKGMIKAIIIKSIKLPKPFTEWAPSSE